MFTTLLHLYQMHSLLVCIIVLALLFDFLNGFHDAANAIATVVVTKTLTPFQAVMVAGLGNFIGYFAFGVAVAKTIGKGVVDISSVASPEAKLMILLAAVSGAILWNIATWLLGLPTSSSHALIGGLIGAGLAGVGTEVVLFAGVLKIVMFIFIAPVLGLGFAFLFTIVTIRLCWGFHPKRTTRAFRWLQLLSTVFFSVGHGTNDAQKTMGIIALALFAGGVTSSFELKEWVVISCYAAISLGTMMGGWRIVKTMGTRITRIQPMEGFCSSTAAALVLLATSHVGIPVSTTHVIAGSIMGVGTAEGAANVRWVTARKIVWAWFLTIPLTALCAAVVFKAIGFFH